MPSKSDIIRNAANASSNTTAPPFDWVPITPAAGDLATPVRAIRANAAGTVTVKTALSGNTERVLNFLAGETRYGYFIAVTAATATGLEGAI